MDTGRLRQGELIAALSAIALFIITFVPWFGFEAVSGLPENVQGVDTGSESFSLWEAESSLDIYLLIAVTFAIVPALIAAGGGAARWPIAPAAATTLLGAIGLVLVFIQLIDPPAELDRKVGVFLGLFAVAGVTAGGWMGMQEEARPITSRPTERLSGTERGEERYGDR
jgi:hypothetical protein